MTSPGKTAALFGATGAVGRQVLAELLEHPSYARVLVLARRSTGAKHAKLVEIITELDALDALDSAAIGGIDDAFCCLGTTQAKAGSADAFRRVDRDMPMLTARFAKRCGARHFLLITAIGADARSPILYNRVKGEAEAAVIAAGLERTSIFRPSLLLAHRDEFRWKEKLGEPFMRILSLVMVGPARRLRPIAAARVARAMVRVAQTDGSGVTVYPSDRIADVSA